MLHSSDSGWVESRSKYFFLADGVGRKGVVLYMSIFIYWMLGVGCYLTALNKYLTKIHLSRRNENFVDMWTYVDHITKNFYASLK